MDHGAQLDAADRDGDTPLMMAAYGGHTGVVKILVDAGANIYKHDRCTVIQGASTAAAHAARRSHADVLRVLMDADARLSEFFCRHEQLERLRAFGSEHPEVIEVLRGYDRRPEQQQ